MRSRLYYILLYLIHSYEVFTDTSNSEQFFIFSVVNKILNGIGIEHSLENIIIIFHFMLI